MTTTRSQTNSEFESIAITDASGLIIGVDVDQLVVADVANLTIPGGSAGQVLSTDGNGVLSWVPATGATVQVASQTIESFTATASQNTFTLARTTNGTVTGSINGVTVAAAAFTVVGPTVTYVPAANNGYFLKAGDRITFTYLYGSTSATELGGLADVTVTTPAAGDVLSYDAGTSGWVNTPATTAFSTLTNGTSNIAVQASGNINFTAAGTANVMTVSATSVAIAGNITATGANVSLGPVGNVKITGGTTGQSLVSTGAGALAFVPSTRFVTYAFRSIDLVMVANFVAVPMIYNSIVYDPDNLYNTTTGRFTPKIAGWYQITAGAHTRQAGEGIVRIVHSVDGAIANPGIIGAIYLQSVGYAYFNGTTDYAYVEVLTSTATTQGQNKSIAPFFAMYVSA
jgi:hypothetical protein